MRKHPEEEREDREALLAGRPWKVRQKIKPHPHGPSVAEYFERWEDARRRQAEMGGRFAELVDLRRPVARTYPKTCPRCRVYIGPVRVPAGGGAIWCPHCARRIEPQE